MGFATPIEQSQYIFPGFKSNSALLMITVGLLSFLMTILKTGKAVGPDKSEMSDIPAGTTP
jgi:hypothetical protein